MDYTKPFSERRKVNIAEDFLVNLYKDDNNVLLIKYGLDLLHVDMPMDKFCKIPEVIRKTPDYIMVHNDRSNAYFLEVKGCKIFLKLKLEDIEAYRSWHRTMNSSMDFIMFIYDTNTKTYLFITLSRLRYLIKCKEYSIKKFFDNKKEYYEIPYSDLQK